MNLPPPAPPPPPPPPRRAPPPLPPPPPPHAKVLWHPWSLLPYHSSSRSSFVSRAESFPLDPRFPHLSEIIETVKQARDDGSQESWRMIVHRTIESDYERLCTLVLTNKRDLKGSKKFKEAKTFHRSRGLLLPAFKINMGDLRISSIQVS